jgi:soluble lytic murein transglycosylase
MKRIRANALSFLVAVMCLAPAVAVAQTEPVPLPDRNPLRAAMPAAPVAETAPESELAAEATTAEAAPDDSAAAETVGMPDRNPDATPEESIAESLPAPARDPTTTSVSMTPVPAAGSNPGPMASVSEVALPDRNPNAPSLLAPPPLPLPVPAPQIVTDMPLPDPNPNRDGALPFAMKGTLAPTSTEPAPAVDYATILKPILSYRLNPSDAANVRETIRSSVAAAERIKDPAARDFALWYKYRNSPAGGNAAAIENFRLAHPDWPAQDELREKAEAALFLTDASADQVKAFFSDTQPQSGAGKAALAGVKRKENDEAAARELVVSAWRDHTLNQAIETKILARYGSWLTAEHHRARIDRLLYPDSKGAIQAALRISKLLPADEQKKVAARVAVVQRGGNAGTLLKALPASAVEADVGLRFNHIQWLRRTKDKQRREQAWQLLLDAPTEPNILLDLNNWWTERRINCRGALNDGNPKVAYEIAAKHGLVTGDGFIEAEFLAGWIALRFLNDPNTALRHFVSLRGASTSSRSIALGEYWLGRTALVLGDQNAAMVHFHAAAKYPQHFYGQLARQSIDSRPAHLEITSTPLPTQADIQAFISRDAVRAIGVALATGYDGALPQFFLALSRKLTNPAEVVLLVELARITGNRQVGLRLAKIAFARDLPVGDYALPIGVMPNYKSLLSDRVDPALLYALSRQESEFNAAAKSPVGAAGLMQLMPGTARATAKAYKVKFDQAQLTNPVYNSQLGEAHLRDLIDSYRGSYFLSLAAYNAGGGRVAEWVKAFGDPREPDVDPIDWIERVPFTETRQYIIKIMESLQLYRSRLAGPKQALQLVQDLNRGRKIPHAEAAVGAQVKSE